MIKIKKKSQIWVQTHISHLLPGRKVFNLTELLKNLREPHHHCWRWWWGWGWVSPLPLRIFAQRSWRWNLPQPPTPDLPPTYVSTHHLSPSNASHLFGYDLSPQQRHKPPEYGEFHLLYFLLYPQRLGHIWPRVRFQTYLTDYVNSSELIHPSAENHTLCDQAEFYSRAVRVVQYQEIKHCDTAH